MQKIKMHISNGFVRDIEGIWHRLDSAAMFFVKVDRKKGKYYSQVLGQYEGGYTYSARADHERGIIEFTRVLGGRKKAQQILDEAFGIEDATGSVTWMEKRRRGLK